MGSDTLDESDASGNVTDEFLFFGGKRIARRNISSGNISFYFADHLGTARAVTNASGAIQDDSDFYPFGGERPILSSSGNTYKFTGKERDSESGLDEFGARYYSSALGRFTIPDWAASATAVPYADFGNPQSLNLYSYVKNNPITFEDPDGHCCWEEVKGFAVGLGNFTVSTAKGLAMSAIPVFGSEKVGMEIGNSIAYAAQQYSGKGASGVMNQVLDQGEQGAMEIVTEAVLTGGMVATARVNGATPESWGAPDANVVVRGGQSEMPAPGTKFSGAQGATVEDAAQGVPHGTIRESTAGEIRKAGGSVRSKPELTASKRTMNQKHVNVREGTKKPSTFSEPKKNPVPKKDRVE